MPKMSLELTDSLQSFVDSASTQQGFVSTDEYVLHVLQKEQDRARVRALIEEGMASPASSSDRSRVTVQVLISLNMNNPQHPSKELVASEAPEKLLWKKYVCVRSIDNAKLEQLSFLIDGFKQNIKIPFDVFIGRMKSLNHIVCLPFMLASKGKIENHRLFKFLRTINHYENNISQNDFETREDWVNAIKSSTSAAVNSNHTDFNAGFDIDHLLKQIANELLNFTDIETVDAVAQDLRYQTVISLWSCIETLLKDHLTSIFNDYPFLIQRINVDEKLKKQLALDRIDLEVLIEHEFNLSSALGNLIFKNTNNGKFSNVRLLLDSIYKKTNLSSYLSSGAIYQLNLKRNLIVHNRGMCDQEYKVRSGTSLDIGQKIDITPGEIINLYQEISQFGFDLAKEFEADLSKD